MKKLLILFSLSILLLLGCATVQPTQTPFMPITLTETANVVGTKNDVYVKANLWLVDIFNSAKSVIQFSDKDAGVIKGKYLLHYRPSSQYLDAREWNATVTLLAIENELKITIVCGDEPTNSYLFGYPATQMNIDLNGLLNRFKAEFENK